MHFALIGAAGFVAPRHLQAIQETGNELVAAVDPHDSVGILDRYFSGAFFFTEIERFDRFLEKLRRTHSPQQVQYISICSPNYLHDAHVRLALRVHAHAICEKPLVINPWNLDQLAELEVEYQRNVYTVLQLRLHPALIDLRARLATEAGPRHNVCLTYVSRRGRWYHTSWKGSEEKSGGLAMNIGVHFFDLLVWLFGEVEAVEVHLATRSRMAGALELARARVRWLLSVDEADLPVAIRQQGRAAFRSMTVDGSEIEFSESFEGLHTRVYEEMLAGRGFRVEDARGSIDLVHRIRTAAVGAGVLPRHPGLV